LGSAFCLKCGNQILKNNNLKAKGKKIMETLKIFHYAKIKNLLKQKPPKILQDN
jgi:predicted nucleic-acid-binding Zn-ribbon protein